MNDDPIILHDEHAEAADLYASSRPLEKMYRDQRDNAKHVLLDALGDHTSGLLPDGRRVTQIVAEFPARYAKKAGELIQQGYAQRILDITEAAAPSRLRALPNGRDHAATESPSKPRPKPGPKPKPKPKPAARNRVKGS